MIAWPQIVRQCFYCCADLQQADADRVEDHAVGADRAGTRLAGRHEPDDLDQLIRALPEPELRDAPGSWESMSSRCAVGGPGHQVRRERSSPAGERIGAREFRPGHGA